APDGSTFWYLRGPSDAYGARLKRPLPSHRALAANVLRRAVCTPRRARVGFAGAKDGLLFRPVGGYCNAAKKLLSWMQVLAAQHGKIFAQQLAEQTEAVRSSAGDVGNGQALIGTSAKEKNGKDFFRGQIKIGLVTIKAKAAVNGPNGNFVW